MSEPVAIRRAAPGDYEAICEMAELMDAPQREALPDRFRKPSGPTRLRDRTEKLMRDADTFLAVAELDGRVVGVTNCGLLRMGDHPQKHLGETRSSKSEFRFKLECSNADRPDSFGIRVSIVIRDSSFGIVLYGPSLPPRSSPRSASHRSAIASPAASTPEANRSQVPRRDVHCSSHRSFHRSHHRTVNRILHCSFNWILNCTSTLTST